MATHQHRGEIVTLRLRRLVPKNSLRNLRPSSVGARSRSLIRMSLHRCQYLPSLPMVMRISPALQGAVFTRQWILILVVPQPVSLPLVRNPRHVKQQFQRRDPHDVMKPHLLLKIPMIQSSSTAATTNRPMLLSGVRALRQTARLAFEGRVRHLLPNCHYETVAWLLVAVPRRR